MSPNDPTRKIDEWGTRRETPHGEKHQENNRSFAGAQDDTRRLQSGYCLTPLVASLYMAAYQRSAVLPVVGDSASLEKRASNSFDGRA